MKVLTKEHIGKNLYDDFAYPDTPDVVSKVSFLDIFNEEDIAKYKKVVTGYWEGPVGTYNTVFSRFNEFAIVMEGEMEYISGDKKYILKEGDYYFVELGEGFTVNVLKPTKTFFVLGMSDISSIEKIRGKLA